MGKIRGYTRDQLYEMGPQRRFSGDSAREVAFPIGGIGTGCVSLSGTGELVDWEIFNRPNKGSFLPHTFFLLRTRIKRRSPVTRILQGRPLPSFTGTPDENHGRFGDGLSGERGIGLPHMEVASMRGEFPIAHVGFEDEDVPLDVSLEAFNPFIPLNPDDSGIPVAVFLIRLHNPGKETVRASLAASLMNAAGYSGVGSFLSGDPGGTRNVFFDAGIVRGILMRTKAFPEGHWRNGSMALATTWNDVSPQTCWERSGWFDSMQRYWDEFSQTGTLKNRDYSEPTGPGQRDTGALALHAKIEPGEVVVLPVMITWHFGVFRKYWGQAPAGPSTPETQDDTPTWKNYYAGLWGDAKAVATYVAANEERLYERTKRFRDTLFDSTMPWYVLDAVSSQMSILKTGTCLRLEDGTFYGFEGVCQKKGCCEGSCTHVWNYAQTLPFLFPSLERSMREADYQYNQRDDGWMCFRLQLPLGSPPWTYHAAADGQMGGIIKTYRDWKLSGNDGWLRKLWPRVLNALEYAWVNWDADKDGVMEGVQHNTYDIEFQGPNTMMGSLYLGALRAASEMAEHLGDDVSAEYQALYESGRAKLEATLFNGDYYVQAIDLKSAPKYQYGDGCLSDQMIGQWMARVAGLGDLFDPKHIRRTLASIYKHNWLTDFYDHACCQRIYAINDDKGLLLCTWPRKGRPELPFVYSDEVWCGIEYQVASHMIYEGLLDEGLCIVRGVRERHDGRRRNPWNEFECGSHYARSMAAWSVLTALSGFSFDMPSKTIGFAPRIHAEEFRSFWSVGSGWGSFRQRLGKKRIKITLGVSGGDLALRELCLAVPKMNGKLRATVDGAPVGKAKMAGRKLAAKIRLPEGFSLFEGQALEIRIS